jgi:hypothetical protein
MLSDSFPVDNSHIIRPSLFLYVYQQKCLNYEIAVLMKAVNTRETSVNLYVEYATRHLFNRHRYNSKYDCENQNLSVLPFRHIEVKCLAVLAPEDCGFRVTSRRSALQQRGVSLRHPRVLRLRPEVIPENCKETRTGSSAVCSCADASRAIDTYRG